MKKTNFGKKEKLGLTKKTIIKLSSGAFNISAKTQTNSSTEGDTGTGLVAFLTL